MTVTTVVNGHRQKQHMQLTQLASGASNMYFNMWYVWYMAVHIH